MNKTLVITTIALVAVVMGFSGIAPSMAFQPIEIDTEVPETDAHAEKVCEILERLRAAHPERVGLEEAQEKICHRG